MKSKTAMMVMIAGCLAGAASAQTNGSYVFTGGDQFVYHLPTGAASATQVADIGPGSRILGIGIGPNNRLFVGNGPFPVQQPVNTVPTMYTIDNWFAGPAINTVLHVGDPLQNPNMHIYHGAYNGVIAVNNPGVQEPLPNRAEGIFHINANTGAATQMYGEGSGGTVLPFYNAGGAITHWTGNANRFFMTAVEGSSTIAPGFTQRASTLHRLDVNPGTLAGTETLLLDMGNTAQTGYSKPIGRANGIANVGDSLYIATFDFEDNVSRIFRADLTPAGTVSSFTLMLDNLPFINDIIYNPYNNKLALGDRSATPGIWEVDLNGANLTKILNDGTLPQRLAVVPAPGALMLLGVGTLVAARRKR